MLDRFDDKDVGSFEEFDYANGMVTIEGMKNIKKINQHFVIIFQNPELN